MDRVPPDGPTSVWWMIIALALAGSLFVIGITAVMFFWEMTFRG